MSDVRLNLGSGPVAVPGWVNIDRSPNVLLQRVPAVKRGLRRAGVLNDQHMAAWAADVQRIDMVKGLPYPDGSVQAIYSSHTFEHLYLADVRVLMIECHRVLAADAVMRVALPDAEQWARDLLAGVAQDGETAGLTFNRRIGSHHFDRPRGIRKLTALGAGSLHRWQPTRDLVRELFDEAGFGHVVERAYRVGDLPDLAVIETRPESLFFEATR
ncbi:MAG TPA: methyltransferase domain-containing protein [Mycobacteriales bacterium]|jgi:SAM-dependent methyltransferase|nr:methyltransferase domain-containing protein [Mycobacteriales bacterium]